jgi:hypothetical protein
MSEKPDVSQGTLALMVLKTIDLLGARFFDVQGDVKGDVLS